jgi:hypothetical protein
MAAAAWLGTACRSPAPAPTLTPVSETSALRAQAAKWWRGNTHTHTLWSDGDDFPEMVAEWYKRSGYHFLALTDHNTLAQEERWFRVPEDGPGREAYRKYSERFAAGARDERRVGDTLAVRLKRLAEYRALVDEPGRFVLLPGEEITQYHGGKAAHMNALNLPEVIPPQTGATLNEILQADLRAVRAMEQRTGREIVAVLNHPNFIWSQTAEDLLQLPELRFFEVYNGHPLVYTTGDSLHAGTERIWDIVLTGRLARSGGLLYGVATDDAHDYHRFAPAERNPGRGWLMVRTAALTPDALAAAMESGDFYASTGIELAELQRDGPRLSLAVRGDPGAAYTIQFVGTRRGYDTASIAVHDSAGTPATRRYASSVGAVLHEVRATSASYAMRGDELYVRARIVSSRPKANPSYAGEVEMAWTQPVRP